MRVIASVDELREQNIPGGDAEAMVEAESLTVSHVDDHKLVFQEYLWAVSLDFVEFAE